MEPMKRVSFTILTVASIMMFNQRGYGQAGCEAIKKENAELKKTLSINAPIVEAEKGDLHFSVTKIEGNSKMQTVTIEVLIKNSGKNLEAFTTGVKSILDPNGNEYKLSDAYIGANDAMFFSNTTLYRDAPLRCKYIFKGIQPEIKMIKLLNFPIKFHVPGTNSFDFEEQSVEFRDFPITWK